MQLNFSTSPVGYSGDGTFTNLVETDVNCAQGYAMQSFKMNAEIGGQYNYAGQCKSIASPSVTENSFSTTPNDWGAGTNLIFLDRHPVICPTTQFLTEFQLKLSGSAQMYYSYTCAMPSVAVDASTCVTASTPSSGRGGGIIYLDRQSVACIGEKILQEFTVISVDATNIRYTYKCCDNPAPTNQPTVSPSYTPSLGPTVSPSHTPSLDPTVSPSYTPSLGPTVSPSHTPSLGPTLEPTYTPTAVRTFEATYTPTEVAVCFSGSSHVETQDHKSKLMSDVKFGEKVLSYTRNTKVTTKS
jgi:hypothetical protein